jgi:hypothetical protein
MPATDLAGPAGRLWARRLRPIAYWSLSVYLLLDVSASIFEFFGYRDDPDTYRRVYLNVDLHLAISHVLGITAAVGLLYQLAGWRERQSSRVAVAVFLLQIGFGLVANYLNIDGICCG